MEEETIRKRKSKFDIPPEYVSSIIDADNYSCSNINNSSKRKSKFDVPPESLPCTNSINNGTPISELQVQVKKKSNFDVLPEDLADKTTLDAAALLLSRALAQVTSSEPCTTQFTEARFLERISKALQKNFDYINKKDMMESGKITAASLLATIKEGQKTNHNLYGGYSKLSAPTRPGIGTAKPKTTLGAVPEVSSVYVAGLPSDIVEEDIEILFGRHGKIKKIKLYTNSDGKKKGDALVTYMKAESVPLACNQYHNRDIGDGFVLSVTVADFSTTSKSKQNNSTLNQNNSNSSSEILLNSSQNLDVYTISDNGESKDDTNETTLKSFLSAESEADLYPVVLLQNVYDYNNIVNGDMDFFVELEADLLLECCKCGSVRRLLSPDHPQLQGCIAVTFENVEGVQKCVELMNDRWFDNRKISARSFIPDHLVPLRLVEAPNGMTDVANTVSQHTEDFLNSLLVPNIGQNEAQGSVNVDSGGTVDTLLVEQETEDFLNSLLF